MLPSPFAWVESGEFRYSLRPGSGRAVDLPTLKKKKKKNRVVAREEDVGRMMERRTSACAGVKNA